MGMWVDNIKKGAIQAVAREIFIHLGVPGLLMAGLMAIIGIFTAFWSALSPIIAFVIGLAIFALVLIILMESRKAYVWWKNRNISQEIDNYMPLSEAARHVYSKLRVRGNSAMVRDFDINHKGTELNCMATAISDQIDVYGKHPPSDRMELIGRRRVDYGSFYDDGGSFHYHGNEESEFVDCSILRNDLDTATREIGDL